MTKAERENHIRELAVENDFALELKPGVLDRDTYGRSGVRPDGGRYVEVAWSGSRLSYFVALHEVGHLVCGHHDSISAYYSRYRSRIVEAEAEAWAWAFAEAYESLSIRAKRLIGEKMLGSYVRDYGLATASTTYASVSSWLGGIAITQRAA